MKANTIEEILNYNKAGAGESKDIFIVVHNQLEYVKKCISSIVANTQNFKLYIWDNASDQETSGYLASLDANVIRSDKNLGFIIPNNRLSELGTSDYFIYLNSDTEVLPNWDSCMIGFLKKNPDFYQVGYGGGKLDQNFYGTQSGFGENIDYVSGYCFCIKRSTYKKYGLFDEQNLAFAYAEDSDYSLTLKSKGHRIYCLYSRNVIHHENKTSNEVVKKIDLTHFIKENHESMCRKWRSYLDTKYSVP